MRRLWIAGLALFALIPAAWAEKLTVAVSTPEIQINSNFTGTNVTVFGVIDRRRIPIPSNASASSRRPPISPQTVTSTCCPSVIPTTRRINRRIDGLSQSYRSASLGLARSAANRNWVRSLVPMDRNDNLGRIRSSTSASEGTSSITP